MEIYNLKNKILVLAETQIWNRTERSSNTNPCWMLYKQPSMLWMGPQINSLQQLNQVIGITGRLKSSKSNMNLKRGKLGETNTYEIFLALRTFKYLSILVRECSKIPLIGVMTARRRSSASNRRVAMSIVRISKFYLFLFFTLFRLNLSRILFGRNREWKQWPTKLHSTGSE